MDRNNNFDFLRFVFAFIVVVSHTIDLSGNKTLLPWAPFFNTHYAITGFFIISGCLISSSYIYSSTFYRYLEKRARRLLPNYIFIIFLCAIGLSLVSSFNLQAYFTNTLFWKYLAANLVFMNFIQPSLPGVFDHAPNIINAVNGALWTLKVEVMFYLSVPVLILLIGNKGSTNLRKIGWLTGIYIAGIVWRAFFISKTAYSPVADLLKAQMPGFLNYFAAGMALFYFNDFFSKKKNILAPIALVVFCLEISFGLNYFKALAFAILIYYVAFNFKFLNHFGRYGDFSYGIYIFHFPIIQLLVSFHFFELVNPWLGLITVIGITLMCSWFSWNYIEKPFLVKKRQ